MLENRQQKPISPQEMFSHLFSQSYRQSECEQQSEKIKKQKIILIQLIQQYEKSIHERVVKINQLSNLEKLRLSKIQELARLKKQRQIIQNSVHQQLQNVNITPMQHEEKMRLTVQLQEVQCVNGQIRLKLKDLHEYINKLQIHNQRLTSEKDIIQTKVANRMRIDSNDWRINIENIRKKQEMQENSMKVKILEKESENIKNIRRQQEQIHKRNQHKWDQFRSIVFKPKIISGSYRSEILKDEGNSILFRKQTERFGSGFRVI